MRSIPFSTGCAPARCRLDSIPFEAFPQRERDESSFAFVESGVVAASLAHAWQTQTTPRASAGSLSISASGMVASKHQQVSAPRAIPQSFPLPQRGQRSGSSASLTPRRVPRSRGLGDGRATGASIGFLDFELNQLGWQEQIEGP